MKRVAIVYDVQGWAWHNRARGIQRYAPPGYQVDIFPQSDYQRLFGSRVYDAVLTMSWIDTDPLPHCPTWTLVANGGLQYPHEPNSGYLPARCASKKKNLMTAKRLRKFTGVICINSRVTDFCRNVNSNTVELRTGVDHRHYSPRYHEPSGKFRIGWSGKAFDDPQKWTPKGYFEVLLPLMERVSAEWVVNRSSHTDGITFDKMPDWYSSLDLFLITSCSEGTPSTLLESMSCGVPFLSTDVGVAGEMERGGWLVDGYSSVDEAARTVDALAERITHIQNSGRELLEEQASAARREIEAGWTWEQHAATWLETMCP